MGRVALMLFAAMFLVYFDNYFAAPVLTQITAVLHTNVEMGGYLIATYSLAAAFGAVVSGPYSDRFGRKRLLQIGLLGFALFTVLCGCAWDFLSMELFRGLCGLFGGVVVANVFAYAGDYCLTTNQAAELPTMMGKVTAGIFVALTLGVPLGIYATDLAGWRTPFIAAGVLAAGLCVVLAGLREIKPASVTGEGYFRSLAQGFRFLLVPQLALPLLIFFLQMIPTAFNTYAPNWIALKGFSLQAIALIYVITGIGSTLAAVRAGSLNKYASTRNILVTLNLVLAGCVLGMVYVPFNIVSITVLFAIYLACLSARMAQMQAFAVQQVAEAERGRYSSLISFCIQLGTTAGVGMSAATLQRLQLTLLEGGIRWIAEGTAVVLAATALACLFLRSRQASAQLALAGSRP